ncbi:MAG: hypothetical protein Q4D38_10045, partial [Planctomycetia bacterium]|nr:hypothetical protein [Planctomycetia bacterium]
IALRVVEPGIAESVGRQTPCEFQKNKNERTKNPILGHSAGLSNGAFAVQKRIPRLSNPPRRPCRVDRPVNVAPKPVNDQSTTDDATIKQKAVCPNL